MVTLKFTVLLVGNCYRVSWPGSRLGVINRDLTWCLILNPSSTERYKLESAEGLYPIWQIGLLPPQQADETLNFEEQILEAAKSIAAATSALVKSASAAQRELVAQGKVGSIPANAVDDGQWSQGLISAVSMKGHGVRISIRRSMLWTKWL